MTAGVVIVGGGQAGFQVAASLRGDGYAGPIRLIGAESHRPTSGRRCPRGCCSARWTRERLLFRQPAFYAAQAIDLLLGETVTALDRPRGRSRPPAAESIPYDTLVLATGTRVRPLPVPGTELDGVVYLRTLDEFGGAGPADRPAHRGSS